jgi:hypothetical protein
MPDEWSALLVELADEAIDGRPEIDDRCENALRTGFHRTAYLPVANRSSGMIVSR